jgi:glutathione S-transferase
MHKRPEFRALSRWGQVPVLIDRGRPYVQSVAIIEYLADTLRRFQGPDPETRQGVREWLYWDVDALFPPIWGCYAVQLDRRKLLPLNIEPAIADYHHRKAETALAAFDAHLAGGPYLCADAPTAADVCCCGDVAFAEMCGFELERWPNVRGWMDRMGSLNGFQLPFELLQMQDAEVS